MPNNPRMTNNTINETTIAQTRLRPFFSKSMVNGLNTVAKIAA